MQKRRWRVRPLSQEAGGGGILEEADFACGQKVSLMDRESYIALAVSHEHCRPVVTQGRMIKAALMCENALIWELGKDLALYGVRCVLVCDLSTGCTRRRVRRCVWQQGCWQSWEVQERCSMTWYSRWGETYPEVI